METTTTKTAPMITCQADEMQIFLRNLDGLTMTVVVPRGLSVGDLQKMIRIRTGLSASQQRLMFGGKQLRSGDALEDYNIVNESTIELHGDLKGGCLDLMKCPCGRQPSGEVFPPFFYYFSFSLIFHTFFCWQSGFNRVSVRFFIFMHKIYLTRKTQT